MTPDALRKRFPNASAAFIRANTQAYLVPVSAGPVNEPAQGVPLVEVFRREEKSQRGSKPGERYRVTYTIHATRPRDWDNLAASCKQLQDAIVDEGWLPGDDWKQLEGQVVSTKCAHKAEERTEVEIVRIA